MQPTPSKRARFNTLMQPPQTPNVDRLFHHNSSSSGEKGSSNFSSSPPLPLPFERLVSISTLRPSRPHIRRPSKPRQSLPIGSKGASHLLFAAYCRAEEENKAETGVIPEEVSEVDANDKYIRSSSEDSNSDKDGFSSKDEDDDHWEDVADGSQKCTRSSWIDAGETPKTKEKLIRILAGDVLLPKQRWSIRRILATLVHHRKDQRLCSALWQFSQFAYQTMMTESERGGRWQGSLSRKKCNLIIRLWFRMEMEKQYGHEVQKLCKSSGFGFIKNKEKSSVLDWEPLEKIVSQAKETAPLLGTMPFPCDIRLIISLCSAWSNFKSIKVNTTPSLAERNETS